MSLCRLMPYLMHLVAVDVPHPALHCPSSQSTDPTHSHRPEALQVEHQSVHGEEVQELGEVSLLECLQVNRACKYG